MSRTSPTWPPTTPKPAWSPPFAEYSPSSRWSLWKRHALSSSSVSRRWLRLKAATLRSAPLHNQISWTYFFNKSFEIKLEVQISLREDAGMRNMSQRGWAPRPPVKQPRRTGKKRCYGHKSGSQYVAVLSCLQLPLTHNPFNKVRGIFF